MRIGIFGGTFDPVHLGHLILAEQCREQARLDQVWFVPSPRPPHKDDTSLTPYHQRVEMLTLAIAGHPAFRVDEIEKDRPGPSFTADTLDELHRRHPGDELFLLLGVDALEDLPMWHQPQRILRAATLVIVGRPGHPVRTADELRALLGMPGDVSVRIEVVTSPLIEVSSTDLRRRAAAGRSLRYLVPRAVEVYIQEKHLYRQGQ
jgi:nicotinate-nucleotide adenylyltransferase